MPWQDRLQEAAYTAPDGTRITFSYSDVSQTIRKKTVAHDFPDVDATFVQDQGLRGSTYPLRVFFSGDDHDLAAAQFVAALKQKGPGILEHPVFGQRDVIPFGDITHRNDLVSAANQSVFDVVFWETVLAIYPETDSATSGAVDQAAIDFEDANAEQFEAAVDPNESAFLSNMQALQDGAESVLKRAQDGTAKLTNKMNRISRGIDDTLTTFVGGPLTLAHQVRQFVTAPARSLRLLRDRLEAYKSMVESIAAGTGTSPDNGAGIGTSVAGAGVVDPGNGVPGLLGVAANLFQANAIFAQTSILGFALAVSGETFTTRTEALQASLELIDVFDDFVAWSDSNYEVLAAASPGPDPTRPNSTGPGAIDTGETYQALLDVVAAAARQIVAASFELATEQVLVIDTPRTAIDLVAELYGDLDRFDEFVDSNRLTGSEILELSRGTRVRFSV